MPRSSTTRPARRSSVLVGTETLQHRVRMGLATLWWALRISIALTLVFTILGFVVWTWPDLDRDFSVGARSDLPRYAWAAWWSDTTFLSIEVRGVELTCADAYLWYRANVYGGRGFWQVFYPYVGRFPVLLVGSFGTSVALLLLLSWFQSRRVMADKRIRGGELVSPRQLRRRVMRGWKDSDLELAGVPLVKDSETRHLLFVGSTGAGKSVATMEILDQVRKRGDQALVLDLSGDYVKAYYRSSVDVIFNPFDARSPVWTPWSEAEGPEHYQALAASLIPKDEHTTDPIWKYAPQNLFADLLAALADKGAASNAEVYRLLSDGSLDELTELLAGRIAGRSLKKDVVKQAEGIIMTLLNRMAFWPYLRDPFDGEQPFSVRDWVRGVDVSKGPRPWLFLAAQEEQLETLRPLMSLLIDTAMRAILSIEPSRSRCLWVILDEVASLDRLPALPRLLMRGRKHGAALILGLQSIPGMWDRYGRDATSDMITNLKTVLVMQTRDPDSADYLTRILGSVELEEPSHGQQMGTGKGRDGESIGVQRHQRQLVLPDEIQSLPELLGYLRLPGYPVAQVKLRPRDREVLAPGFAPLGDVL